MPVQSRVSIHLQEITRVTGTSGCEEVDYVIVSHSGFAFNATVVGAVCFSVLIVVVDEVLVHWMPHLYAFHKPCLISGRIRPGLIKLEGNAAGIYWGCEDIRPILIRGSAEEDVSEGCVVARDSDHRKVLPQPSHACTRQVVVGDGKVWAIAGVRVDQCVTS